MTEDTKDTIGGLCVVTLLLALGFMAGLYWPRTPHACYEPSVQWIKIPCEPRAFVIPVTRCRECGPGEYPQPDTLTLLIRGGR